MYNYERFKYQFIYFTFMAEQSIFLEYVGDTPRMRILQYFIEGKELDYTLTDLLNAGVSWGTLNQLVPKLLELRIVVKTRKIGRATLYKINQENKIAKHFIVLYNDLILGQLDKLEEGQTIKLRVTS